jgi:hypothetical protein
MEFEKIGELPLRPGAIHDLVPELRNIGSGDMAAIHDISISNSLSIGVFSGNVSGPLVENLL